MTYKRTKPPTTRSTGFAKKRTICAVNRQLYEHIYFNENIPEEEKEIILDKVDELYYLGKRIFNKLEEYHALMYGTEKSKDGKRNRWDNGFYELEKDRKKKMNNDEYYLEICNTIAKKSKCFSRQIGAILVLDKSIISTGYNGPPRGVPHCNERFLKDDMIYNKLVAEGKTEFLSRTELHNTCPRWTMKYKSGEGLQYCIAGHAERNCLINAARHGVAVKGASLYLNTNIPCKDCMIEIINAGIEEIVVCSKQHYDNETPFLVKYSGIKIHLFGEE